MENRGMNGLFVGIGLNGVFECIFVFNSSEKIWQYFCTDNASLEMPVHLLSEDIVSFENEVGVYEKFAEM